jgi:hypothetical protein
MRVTSGLIRPIRGSKHMEGIDLVTTPSHRIVDLRIEHVPENRRLFPRMTVEDNLRMGGFNPPGNRPRWGAEMQIHVQGSSRYHIIPGIPLIASELLTFATLGDHRRYVCISKTVIAYRSAPFDITHQPISPEFACLTAPRRTPSIGVGTAACDLSWTFRQRD